MGPALRMSDMGGTGDPLYGAFEPDVALNYPEQEYITVWSGDDNSGGLVDNEFEIFGQLITWDGTGTGPNDFRISDVGGVGDPDYDVWWGPEVAYSPILDQYMVAWGGEDNVGGMVSEEWRSSPRC